MSVVHLPHLMPLNDKSQVAESQSPDALFALAYKGHKENGVFTHLH